MLLNNKIEYFLEKPVCTTSKLAVLLPGYLDHCDYDHLKTLAKDLATAGYLTIRFNPTGTWGSKGTIDSYNITQYLKDVEESITWATAENGHKFDQIIIAGHSLGGQVALQYGLTHPTITATIGIMPAFGKFEEDNVTKRWKESGFRKSERSLPGSEQSKTYLVPFSFLLDRQRYPVAIISNSATPKLLLAGELDDAVPAASVHECFESLAEPKKFVLLTGIGHDYRLQPDEIARANKEILDFLASLN